MTQFEATDTNGDGVIDQYEWERMKLDAERERLADENTDRDSKRFMCMVCLAGMLLYPSAVIFTEFLGLPAASQLLASMANIYYPSVSLVVGSYFGFSAMSAKKEAK
jgi:hypothetical protein